MLTQKIEKTIQEINKVENSVEKQATDCAYRIGQRKNILVHKLICRTSEEKINEVIIQKKDLASEILQEGNSSFLTELDNNENLKMLLQNVC